MTTLDFEDFFESSLSFNLSAGAKAKNAPTSKFTPIKKPVTKKPKIQVKPKVQVKPKTNIISSAVAKQQKIADEKKRLVAENKKLAVAKTAKKTAITVSTKAKLIAKSDPVKSKILAAKAVTLGKTADKLVRSVNVNADGKTATPLSVSLPEQVKTLKTVTSVVKEQIKEQPPSAKKEEKLAKAEVIEDKLNTLIAVQGPPVEQEEPSLNDLVLEQLDALEQRILNEQDSVYRRRVLGKLASLQRRVNSGSLAYQGVYA